MGNEKSLTRSLGTKITPTEEAAIKATATRLGIDVSTFVRRAVLHELNDGPIDASEAMLELFIRTMEASLELGDQFTGTRFRQLCAEVKAQCSGKACAQKSENKDSAQT